MEFKAPQYFIVIKRPVKSEKDGKGNLRIYAYNWDTGSFKVDMNYLKRVYTRREDDVQVVSKEAFEAYVAQLERERLYNESTVPGSNIAVLPDETLGLSLSFKSSEEINAVGFETLLALLDQSFLPKPTRMETTDEAPATVSSFTDHTILEALQHTGKVVLASDHQTMSMSLTATRTNGLAMRIKEVALKEVATEDLKTLFVQLIQLSKPLVATIYFNVITEKIYEEHFLDTDEEEAAVISWLEYFRNDKFEERGGDVIFKQTHIDTQQIAEGFLLQVNSSPYDAYTPEGEKQAVEATKALPLWDISYH